MSWEKRKEVSIFYEEIVGAVMAGRFTRVDAEAAYRYYRGPT